MIYLENPRESTAKLSKAIREASEIMRYNANIQKLLGFIFQQTPWNIKNKKRLYKRTTQNKKYLGINLLKV